MTVAVACNLAEGVVLGVDSAVTLSNQQGEVVKTYEHATKLFQLGGKPVGIAIYGSAALGNRIVGSYVREFETKDPAHVVTVDATMREIVEQLRLFFLDQYGKIVIPEIEARTGKKYKDIPMREIPFFGFAVGGFSAKKYLSEVWEIRIPFDETPYSAKLWSGEGDFRPVWFSLNEPIVRYQLGYDRNLIAELKQYFAQLRGSPLTNTEEAAITDILNRHEYQIPFNGMPIGEGIAYVKFVVEMVINHYRFALGAPVVGGKAQIGLVTYKGDKFQILEGEQYAT
jgi:hypothetical protein